MRAVMMPYRFTSSDSIRDADACAKALGVTYQTLPIEDAVAGLSKTLAPALAGTQADTTEENIQARARGIILMALSNKFGGMVLTTGNKSEMSVGYATLYGDMNGGYNPIKDLYKMEVYRLARWRNAHVPRGGKGPPGEVIPREHHHQGADRGAASQPDRSGFVAAVRGAGRHPRVAGREGDAAGRYRRDVATRRKR